MHRSTATAEESSVSQLIYLTMLHAQANLNTLNSGAGVGKSLLMGWVEAVVASFKSYAAWPIVR